MDSTTNRALILAKLRCFYTVEVRNLDMIGTVQAKADLLVMENLFYRQKPTKTSDLKGIQGRKALFDSEWIEGQCQQRALTLVNPVSEAILQESRKSDYDFLSKSNIMDYSYDYYIACCCSLQIHCGLVDTISSYMNAKTLEYKEKGLSGKDGQNITVVPPHEYQERYFMACPDRWTIYHST
ncbi:hypothetical protein F5888DRAFT_1694661 [Russula emetica]|nr:hypothetical protein F5888DRAFT_1694661 [Russula emetica]